MKRIYSFFVLLIIVLTIVAGCRSTDDCLCNVPLSQETKDAVDRAILTDLGYPGIYWDFPGYYYGTINNCIIVNNINPDSMYLTVIWKRVVGNCVFWWGHPIELFVFKDGEACTLSDAYSRGWLNDEHIQQIYDHHEDFRANYTQYFTAWRSEQEKNQGS